MVRLQKIWRCCAARLKPKTGKARGKIAKIVTKTPRRTDAVFSIGRLALDAPCEVIDKPMKRLVLVRRMANVAVPAIGG
ncbi:hypothetical protein NBRC116594_23520 [Shimia sp. NS0008-38b]